jgi:hypothetical protein
MVDYLVDVLVERMVDEMGEMLVYRLAVRKVG